MTVWDQADSILRDVASRLTSPPDRIYVTDGTPAFDCEQLTLHVHRLSRGTVDRERPTHSMAPMTVGGRILRLWKVPVTDRQIPRTREMVSSGKQVMSGGEELWHAVTAVAKVHDCRPAMDEAISVGPEGGFAGWQIVLRWNP